MLCVLRIARNEIHSVKANNSKTPNNEVNYENTLGVEEKRRKQKVESDVVNVNHATKRNSIFKRPALKMKNMIATSKQRVELKVKKRESGYFITASATDRDFFGGRWASELAGVWFIVDPRSAAGADKYVKISVGAKSAGFMNKNWIAKAIVLYGRHGPVSLSAINSRKRKYAVFVGFAHSKNNKYFVTGMWSIGRNCRNNSEVHQSVINVPDVLRKDSA